MYITEIIWQIHGIYFFYLDKKFKESKDSAYLIQKKAIQKLWYFSTNVQVIVIGHLTLY